MLQKLLKKLSLKRVVKETLSTLLIIFVLANIVSYLRAPELSSELLPSINQRLISGEKFNSSTLNQKPLMIHFWATWCPVCKAEASNIQSVSEDYNVITIAVKSGSDAKIKSYLQERGLTLKTLNDNMSYQANAFKVSVFPTTFIYDREKKLRFIDVGYTSTWMLKAKMFYLSL